MKIFLFVSIQNKKFLYLFLNLLSINTLTTNIKEFEKSELSEIEQLFPLEWNFDFEEFISIHNDKSYFKGFTLIHNTTPIWFGNIILFGKIAWLGNIVISQKYRNQGLGKIISSHLIDVGKQNSVKSFILIATELGEFVYRKLGFERELMYEFYKKEGFLKNFEPTSNIRKVHMKELEAISDLDYKITGEYRKELFESFIYDTYIIMDSKKNIAGYFVKNLGNGLLIADQNKHGIELLKEVMKSKEIIIMPETNIEATTLLIDNGYQKTGSYPRMIFGEKYSWNSEKIFSRGAGYVG